MRKIYRLTALILFVLVTGTAISAQAQDGPVSNHLALYVKDLKKSEEFYKNVMKLSEIPEPFHDGKHVWFRTGAHSQLHIIQGSAEVIAHDINTHYAYSVKDLSVFTRHLDAMKVKYGDWNGTSTTPTKRPDGVKQVYLQDPDNFWIEVNDDRF